MPRLIEDNVNNYLNLLVQKLFEGNRILDRQMSVLSVKFIMNKTSDILHPLLAHAMPLLADKISTYQDSRNCLTIYLETPTDSTDYNSPKEVFNRFLNYMSNLEMMIDEIIGICEEEKDRMTKVFLENFLLEIQIYTKQALLLVDKIEMYGNDSKALMNFDRDIKNFIVVKQFKEG